MTRDAYGYVKYENPQTLNLYAYCNNNPVNHTDPNGNNPLLIGMAAGALIGGGAAAIYSYYKTGSVDWGLVLDWGITGAMLGCGVGELAACGLALRAATATFKAGEMFESKFVSSKGIELGGLADVEISGKTLTLKDVAIYSTNGNVPNAVGAREIIQWQNEIAQMAKKQGFNTLNIQGLRVSGSSSANPGKAVNYTID